MAHKAPLRMTMRKMKAQKGNQHEHRPHRLHVEQSRMTEKKRRESSKRDTEKSKIAEKEFKETQEQATKILVYWIKKGLELHV